LLWSLRTASREQKLQHRLGLAERGEPTRELRLWCDGREAATTVPSGPRRPSLMQRLEQLREAAGWKTSAQKIVMMLLAAAGTAFVLLWTFSGDLLVSVAGAALLVAAVRAFLLYRVSKRQALFETQLVDGLDLAARSLRAGHPLLAAFNVIAEEIAPPAGAVFTKICQQQALGVSLQEALRRTAESATSSDLKLLATSVDIQLRSGGNLADMMEHLAGVIRARMQLHRHARVLTAQTQLSKRLLLAMPIALFLILSILNPGYMRPLYTTDVGRGLLIVGGTGLILGAWIMKRLIVLKY